jgi:predicted MFS family arabinose efflux permease
LAAAPETSPALSGRTLALMAGACTASVANIYYNQPLLGNFATQFGATALAASGVAMAAQAGYGFGLLFFLPLGDLVERRRLILALTLACAALLAFIAAAPSLPLLIAGHFLMGTTAVGAQVIIPLATDLVPAQARGRTVGVLMGGVLCGILLARTWPVSWRICSAGGRFMSARRR